MTTISIRDHKVRRLSTLVALTASTALALSACSSGDDSDTPASSEAAADVTITEPVAVTYDGGVALLDGESLEPIQQVEMDGFLRVNPAGDDNHVMVSTDNGFSVLDATHASLTDVSFDGSEPGHVVLHGGKTVLYFDGDGRAVSFDPHELAEGEPQNREYTSAEPHHGVAVELADGTMISSVGNEETRSGARAVDADGNEIATSSECPGIHGEAVAADEVVGFGCQDGVLLFKDGEFVKVPGSNPEYAYTGTQAGSEASPILLGDYKVDPDAEREFPTQFALVDTVTEQQRVVPMPEGVSYSFRSLGRGPDGEALILGTDGQLHVIDPATGAFTQSIPVVDEWQEPMDWQDPRPAIFVREATVYVTDPATNSIKSVDIASGEVSPATSLDFTPNEISGTLHEH
ncbi:zinc metallochaperone AztD [Gordonia sp. PKS22-38]|uniref:Zinc metallochaperone AztD n=1 Tax=Gordonia prachuapensis TaxID=3115651 RepID=A0ABU7MPJ6_9ACTN|nr:zinc metallochaperone AztD [Gordonia sp. PKS22-38]